MARPGGRRLPAGRFPGWLPGRRDVSSFGIDDAPDDFDIGFQVIQGTANVVYTFTTAEESTFRPYLIGGVGLYNQKATGDDSGDPDSQTDFGINGGAGFDFQLGSVGLFVEGRFHNIFSDPDNTNFVPISVGVRFGGGGPAPEPGLTLRSGAQGTVRRFCIDRRGPRQGTFPL